MRSPLTPDDPAPSPETDLPRMPGWIGLPVPDTLEAAAFASGAALAVLQIVQGQARVPLALWQDRLALAAAVACVGLAGRREGEGDLRDAVHLARPGDQPGPAGEVLQSWRRAVQRPVSVAALQRALPRFSPAQITDWLEAGGSAEMGGGAEMATAVARAARVLEAVRAAAPQAEAAALILADAALARALRRGAGRSGDGAAARGAPLLPLLAAGLKPRDLRKTGEDLRLACHRAVVVSASAAVQMAADLARRADRLRSIAPRLRARGADQAVALFLARDALAPVALCGPGGQSGAGAGMSDRAARRLCDRLVDLGAVRELTGRDSFRLYGV